MYKHAARRPHGGIADNTFKESVVDFGALAPDLLAFFVMILGKRW
jgi:hypothetical protein